MQIVNFRANLRKKCQLILIEEGLKYQLELTDPLTIANHKRFLQSKLTNFWIYLSLIMYILFQKKYLLSIQVWILVSKFHLV